MQLRDNMKSALSIMGKNKLRSFLTMLGIIIGVMAVIVIMSAGAGAQSLIVNQISSLGSNLVGVLPGKSDAKGPPVSVLGVVIKTLTLDDAKAIANGGFPHITAVASYVRGAASVTSGDNKTDATFVGTTAGYVEVENITVERGRFFGDEEVRGNTQAAVIGSDVATELFPFSDPIGETIKIKRTPFTIIGVMKKRGVVAFQNQDNQIFVPITTAQKLLLGVNYINLLRAKVDAAENVDASMEYIQTILRERHRVTDPENDDFSIRSANQGIEALTGITNALRFFLAAIAGMSLVVGGIGIMNIMLAAVTERTREIGLRKAVGARAVDISRQFLVETLAITLLGGIIGVVVGVFFSVLIAVIAGKLGYAWDLSVPFSSIVVGCVVSAGVGLLFGIIPARRAARLNPIEALRYE